MSDEKPPPYTQQPQAQGGQNVVIVQTPQFTKEPYPMTCPHCNASITTNVTLDNGTCTWLSCVICCLIGCDFGCCLIPFCVDDFKDAIHTCPSCNRQVGSYKKIG